MKPVGAVMIAALLTTGCLFGVHHEKLTDEYVLSALDSSDDMSLMYLHNGDTMINVVAPRVTAYGQHENFIIVSREPPGGDQAATEYFFVPLSDPRISAKGDENVVGPVSLEEVTIMAVERGGIPPVKFMNL